MRTEDIKDQIINKITLLDTSHFRCSGLAINGKYRKEPRMFRLTLYRIYSSLDVDQLTELLKLKNGL
jgi:hypothetical protein